MYDMGEGYIIYLYNDCGVLHNLVLNESEPGGIVGTELIQWAQEGRRLFNLTELVNELRG